MKKIKILQKNARRTCKKIVSCVVACSMLASGLSLGTISTDNLEVKAAQPEQMKMPIVVLDHLNDNLLFEYLNVDKIFGLTMFKDNPGDPDSEEYGKGLVENELGPNGTPVYKQEIVERVAGIVQYTLETIRSENGYDARTDITNLYRTISSQILSTEPEQSTIEEYNDRNVTKTLEEMG